MSAIAHVPHARLIPLLGQVVQYSVNPEVWGILVAVDGEWATIAGPPDCLGNRRKDEVLAKCVVADPT